MPFIKILGAFGGKSKNMHLTSLQVSNNCVIDAGNLIDPLGDDIKNIDHIFISHSHLDHIVDIPFLIDDTFSARDKPLKIYGQEKNLQHLQKHILNWEIWPDFSEIPLYQSTHKAVEFIPIKLNEPMVFEEFTITAIENNHTPSSNGYIITKDDHSILFTSDTYCCDSIWEHVNSDTRISAVIIDVSFPSSFEKLAFDSKHLTPKLLQDELKKLKRDDVSIYINHLKPSFKDVVTQEIEELQLLLNNGSILHSGVSIDF